MAIPKKVIERITTQMKKYQGIIADAKDRDISESDTVVIIADMLADVLGYKKYVEITTEFAIRGTFVDLSVRVGDTIRFLIEVKAVGGTLKDSHVKQAVDYGANQGAEWIILTNGIEWHIYKIQFRQPIDKTLIYEFDFLKASPRDPQIIDCLGNLSREGFTQSSMASFSLKQQATNRFSLAAIVLSTPMLQALKKELKRISPAIKVDDVFLKGVLQNEVLKREVVDSADAKHVAEFLKRAYKASNKPKAAVDTAAKPILPENDKIVPILSEAKA
ncbi:MAG: type I restriction enzyme HsdR N-terminal domain-containing protein [Syntrophales bacterium]|nr:type I restriction enzyme HsdR N-terminal domain-containing protein [Syntrophales bacterium]